MIYHVVHMRPCRLPKLVALRRERVSRTVEVRPTGSESREDGHFATLLILAGLLAFVLGHLTGDYYAVGGTWVGGTYVGMGLTLRLQAHLVPRRGPEPVSRAYKLRAVLRGNALPTATWHNPHRWDWWPEPGYRNERRIRNSGD